MKKCILIFLSFAILLNSCGYLFLFIELKKQNKKEMLEKISSLIPDKEITKITFLKSSIPDWNITDEFEYNGCMYDVVKIEDKGKFVVYSCINDKKEEILVRNLKKHFDDSKNNSGNSTRNNHLQLIGFSAILNNAFSLIKGKSLFGHIGITSPLYNSVTTDISSPPPRNLFI